MHISPLAMVSTLFFLGAPSPRRALEAEVSSGAESYWVRNPEAGIASPLSPLASPMVQALGK